MARRSQPYHRAGSIDNNARFATEHAAFLQIPDKRRSACIWGPHTASDDQLSILVGEPLYTVKRQRLNDPRPISVLSSLNAYSLFNETESARFIGAAEDAIASDSGSIVDKLRAYGNLRNVFFDNLAYTGVSIDVWDRGERRQGDRLAITHAGLNTIECDAPFRDGDLVIADMPWPEDTANAAGQKLFKNGGAGVKGHSAHGLFETNRNGRKIMLAVVPMPRRPPEIHTAEEMRAWVDFTNGFHARGQIMGRCTIGNQGGKGTIDLIMGTFAGGQC